MASNTNADPNAFNEEMEYQKTLTQYHQNLLPSFQDKEEINLDIRLKEIAKIINNNCRNSDIQFEIPQELFDEMFNYITPEIYDHTRVHSTKCKDKIMTEEEYKKPARNMLNRWKPAILGNHVVHKIIFMYLYNHCYTLCRMDNKDDDEILILFVSIFDIILSSPVKFPQARPLPLIFHAIFDKDNHFKKACINFLKHFKLYDSWNNTKISAENKFNSFRSCLQEIITKKQINNAILPPMLHHNIMTIDEPHQLCKIHYKRVIEKFLICWESEENMDDSDKLSKTQDIIFIISTYHHNDMEFFTINKSMVSNHPRLYPMMNQITSTYDHCDDRTVNMSDSGNVMDEERMITFNDGKSKSVESYNDHPMNNYFHHQHQPSHSYQSSRATSFGSTDGGYNHTPVHNHVHPQSNHLQQNQQPQHVQRRNMNTRQLQHTHSNDCILCQQNHNHNHHHPYHHGHGINKHLKIRSNTIDGSVNSTLFDNGNRDYRVNNKQSEFPQNVKYTNNNQQNKPQQIQQNQDQNQRASSWQRQKQQDTYNKNYLYTSIGNTPNTSTNTGSNNSNVPNHLHNPNMNTIHSNNIPNYNHYQHSSQQQQPQQPQQVQVQLPPSQIPRQHSYPSPHQFQPPPSPHQMQQYQVQPQAVSQSTQQQSISQTQHHSVHHQQQQRRVLQQQNQWMNNGMNDSNPPQMMAHPMDRNLGTGSDFLITNSDPMDQDDISIPPPNQYQYSMTMPQIGNFNNNSNNNNYINDMNTNNNNSGTFTNFTDFNPNNNNSNLNPNHGLNDNNNR